MAATHRSPCSRSAISTSNGCGTFGASDNSRCCPRRFLLFSVVYAGCPVVPKNTPPLGKYFLSKGGGAPDNRTTPVCD